MAKLVSQIFIQFFKNKRLCISLLSILLTIPLNAAEVRTEKSVLTLYDGAPWVYGHPKRGILHEAAHTIFKTFPSFSIEVLPPLRFSELKNEGKIKWFFSACHFYNKKYSKSIGVLYRDEAGLLIREGLQVHQIKNLEGYRVGVYASVKGLFQNLEGNPKIKLVPFTDFQNAKKMLATKRFDAITAPKMEYEASQDKASTKFSYLKLRDIEMCLFTSINTNPVLISSVQKSLLEFNAKNPDYLKQKYTEYYQYLNKKY